VPVGGGSDEAAGLDVDAGFGEILAQSVGGGGAEDVERRVLRRVDADLHVVDAHAVCVPGSHQGQLVGR
jgi:hypothetical protein